MDSRGLFIADDNPGIGGVDFADENLPEIIMEFFRFMPDYSDLKGLDASIWGTSPGMSWIVDVTGGGDFYPTHSGEFCTAGDTVSGVPDILQHSSGITDLWGVYQIFGRTGRDLRVPENLDARDTSMAIVALAGTVKNRMYPGDDEAEIKKWWITSVKKLLGVPLTG